MDDDFEHDIQASINELRAKEEGNGQQSAPAPAPTAPAPAAQEETNRDPAGRFAPRTPAQPVSSDKDSTGAAPAPADQNATAPAPAPAEPTATSRAPVSWKPEVREKWATLDPVVQAEISRRENDMNTALREVAPMRRTLEQVNGVIAPYMHMFQSEGVQPLQAVESLLRTAATLRTAPPQQKAALVAEMIGQFGVDIGMLDQVLTQRLGPNGQFQQDPMQGVLQQIDTRLAPVQQFMNEFQQMRQQASVAPVQNEITAFASDPKNEFFNDVRDLMADMLSAAAQRGQTMSLSEAYNRATMLHPQIADIIAQRRLTNAAQRQQQQADAARHAGASVTGNGAPPQGSETDDGDSIRSALGASVRQLSQ